jgi:Apea-like HEPN
MQNFDFKMLKEKQRQLRDHFPSPLGLRVHRSISWLQRSELSNDDNDAKFIFLWISFNAAYSHESILSYGERSNFEDFFIKIIELDKDQNIYKALWSKFSGPVRLIIDNKYVYQPFWNYHNQIPNNDDWEDRFQRSRKRLYLALSENDTKLILKTVFDRLYVLRNQIVHGGATWNSSINRSQIRDGSEILSFLIPVFINIMMDNPHADWGMPHYPVLEG